MNEPALLKEEAIGQERDFELALSACLEAIEQGATAAEVVAAYPAHEELADLIGLAQAIQAVPLPAPRAPLVFRPAVTKSPSLVPLRAYGPRALRWLPRVSRGAQPALRAAVVLVPLLLGWSIISPSSVSAMPGQPLYPIKRLKEQVELVTALSETARAERRLAHVDARLAEASSEAVDARTRASLLADAAVEAQRVLESVQEFAEPAAARVQAVADQFVQLTPTAEARREPAQVDRGPVASATTAAAPKQQATDPRPSLPPTSVSGAGERASTPSAPKPAAPSPAVIVAVPTSASPRQTVEASSGARGQTPTLGLPTITSNPPRAAATSESRPPSRAAQQAMVIAARPTLRPTLAAVVEQAEQTPTAEPRGGPTATSAPATAAAGIETRQVSSLGAGTAQQPTEQPKDDKAAAAEPKADAKPKVDGTPKADPTQKAEAAPGPSSAAVGATAKAENSDKGPATPRVDVTPNADSTPGAERSEKPENTPKPNGAVRSAATSKPEATPKPGDKPKAETTPRPDEKPKADAAPKADATPKPGDTANVSERPRAESAPGPVATPAVDHKPRAEATPTPNTRSDTKPAPAKGKP